MSREGIPTIPVLAIYCEATQRLIAFELRIGGKGIYLQPDDARELHEQLAYLFNLADQREWTVERCNEAMGDGFSGTENSSVAAVCDSLVVSRAQSDALAAALESIAGSGIVTPANQSRALSALRAYRSSQESSDAT